jgi:hypothetical protein
MNDLTWSAALFWFALGAGFALVTVGTWKKGKRRNKRIGLPAPECQRVPAFEADRGVMTRRQAE